MRNRLDFLGIRLVERGIIAYKYAKLLVNQWLHLLTRCFRIGLQTMQQAGVRVVSRRQTDARTLREASQQLTATGLAIRKSMYRISWHLVFLMK